MEDELVLWVGFGAAVAPVPDAVPVFVLVLLWEALLPAELPPEEVPWAELPLDVLPELLSLELLSLETLPEEDDVVELAVEEGTADGGAAVSISDSRMVILSVRI